MFDFLSPFECLSEAHGLYCRRDFVEPEVLSGLEQSAQFARWQRVTRSYENQEGDLVTYSDRLLQLDGSDDGPFAKVVDEFKRDPMAEYLSNLVLERVGLAGRVEVHGLEYGDSVEWHTDRSPGRSIAVVLYLSSWQSHWGGALLVRERSGELIRHVPQRGTLVALDLRQPSEHGVEPITTREGIRMALTTWYGPMSTLAKFP